MDEKNILQQFQVAIKSNFLFKIDQLLEPLTNQSYGYINILCTTTANGMENLKLESNLFLILGEGGSCGGLLSLAPVLLVELGLKDLLAQVE